MHHAYILKVKEKKRTYFSSGADDVQLPKRDIRDRRAALHQGCLRQSFPAAQEFIHSLNENSKV
jgi:hypothetical protein